MIAPLKVISATYVLIFKRELPFSTSSIYIFLHQLQIIHLFFSSCVSSRRCIYLLSSFWTNILERSLIREDWRYGRCIIFDS